MKDIRSMAVAGMFYPRSPEALREMVESFLDEAETPHIQRNIDAIIVPHAGFIYSGQTAAYAYKAVKDSVYDIIILIGPNHRRTNLGTTSVYCRGGFQTPLGIMMVDEQAAMEILRFSCSDDDMFAHQGEHSLEVQLPFLQIVQPHARIVPIVMSDDSPKGCKNLAKSIKTVLDNRKSEKILIVASTDLSHYHDDTTAKKMDALTIECIQKNDAQGLYQEMFKNGNCELCGFGPVFVVLGIMETIKGKKWQILHYSHSGECSGDNDRVVGYVSAAF